jgi:hypothetical protein
MNSTKIDIHNMMLDLDKNRDGKISVEEFEFWWLSGRAGPTGAMSKIFGIAVNGYGKSIGGVWSEEAMNFAKASKADVYWDEKSAKGCKLEFNINDGINKERAHDDLTLFGKVWLGGADAYKEYGILKQRVTDGKDTDADVFLHM